MLSTAIWRVWGPLVCFAFFFTALELRSICFTADSPFVSRRPNGSLHLHLNGGPKTIGEESWTRKQLPNKDHVTQPSVCRRSHFCREQWFYTDLRCNQISMNWVKRNINPSQQYAGLREAILVSKRGISTNKTIPAKMQKMALLKPLIRKRWSTHPHGAQNWIQHQLLPAFHRISTSKIMNKKTSKCCQGLMVHSWMGRVHLSCLLSLAILNRRIDVTLLNQCGLYWRQKNPFGDLVSW